MFHLQRVPRSGAARFRVHAAAALERLQDQQIERPVQRFDGIHL